MTPHSSAPRRRWLIGAALAGAFLSGGVTMTSVAALAQDAPMGAMMGHRHGDMAAVAKAHVDHMLDEIGASADQKARIQGILKAGFAPMVGFHAQMRETHGQLLSLLTAPVVDRAAIEQLRAGEITKIDQASRSMTAALADAADVLRADQRAKLATMAAHHPKAP